MVGSFMFRPAAPGALLYRKVFGSDSSYGCRVSGSFMFVVARALRTNGVEDGYNEKGCRIVLLCHWPSSVWDW